MLGRLPTFYNNFISASKNAVTRVAETAVTDSLTKLQPLNTNTGQEQKGVQSKIVTRIQDFMIKKNIQTQKEHYMAKQTGNERTVLSTPLHSQHKLLPQNNNNTFLRPSCLK